MLWFYFREFLKNIRRRRRRRATKECKCIQVSEQVNLRSLSPAIIQRFKCEFVNSFIYTLIRIPLSFHERILKQCVLCCMPNHGLCFAVELSGMCLCRWVYSNSNEKHQNQKRKILNLASVCARVKKREKQVFKLYRQLCVFTMFNGIQVVYVRAHAQSQAHTHARTEKTNNWIVNVNGKQ